MFWKTFKTHHKMRGRNREFQYFPAKIVGKITKCQYLPSKIATFETHKNQLKIRFRKMRFQAQLRNTQKIYSKYKLDPILGGVWKFRFLYLFPASAPNCTLKPIFRPSPRTRLGPGGGLAALWQAALRLAGSRLSWHVLAACLPGACNPLGLEAQRGSVISMRVPLL